MIKIIKVIALLISVVLAVLAILFIFDFVGKEEMRDLTVKILEVGGVILALSLVTLLVLGTGRQD